MHTCSKSVSMTLSYKRFHKVTWKKEPVLGSLSSTLCHTAMLCKISDFYVFKQHNVKTCSNKWYSCSKAMLYSHFSSGKTVQSQCSSGSDIRDYRLSKEAWRNAATFRGWCLRTFRVHQAGRHLHQASSVAHWNKTFFFSSLRESLIYRQMYSQEWLENGINFIWMNPASRERNLEK